MVLQFNYAMADRPDLDNVPLAQAPDGMKSDLVTNPGNQINIMLGISSVLLVAMLLAVGLRFYTKVRILQSWFWDDITLMLGFIGTVGVYILTCMFGVVSKVGSHVWNVPLGLVYSTTWTSENDCYYTLVPIAMGLVKITFFIYLYNTFYRFRRIRLVTMAGIIFTTLFYTAIFIAQLALWVPSPGHPRPIMNTTEVSLSMNIVLFTMSCGGVVLDLIIWTTPLFAFSHMLTAGQSLWGIGSIFLVGLVAITASCVSVVYRARSDMTWDSDFMFFAMPALLSAFVELSCGCIAASLPTLVVFYLHVRRRSRSDSLSSTASNNGMASYAAEDSSVSISDRGRQQYLRRKASVLSDGVMTISEHMAAPFSKIGELSRKSSITALPQLERDTPAVELQHRRSSSADALARNGSALAEIDEHAQAMSSKSFENFKSRDIEPWERWEALKSWPPQPPASGARATNRYVFGD